MCHDLPYHQKKESGRVLFFVRRHIGRSVNAGMNSMADLHSLANHLCMQITSPHLIKLPTSSERVLTFQLCTVKLCQLATWKTEDWKLLNTLTSHTVEIEGLLQKNKAAHMWGFKSIHLAYYNKIQQFSFLDRRGRLFWLYSNWYFSFEIFSHKQVYQLKQ